ncbi:MAG: hypothetical protein H6835_05500 [Planctomycetes bacterium]|nr:hypothetical protein [Planctomycetota bacterium]
MNPSATLLACGLVDASGIAGSRGTDVTWASLGTPAPGGPSTMKHVFDKQDATFRRIDLPARALVLACEAADLGAVLDEEQRNRTAIVVETDIGSLATDLAFARSLGEELVHAGIFPYSLTSTCLGEIALRYKLRGASVSVSVTAERRGAALREALRMLAGGECEHVLTGTVEALLEPAHGHEAQVRAVVALLGRSEAADAARSAGLGEVAWPDERDDPFVALARRCR